MGACLAARSTQQGLRDEIKSIGHSPRLYLLSRLFASIRGLSVICVYLRSSAVGSQSRYRFLRRNPSK
jgi:hypothetical protein